MTGTCSCAKDLGGGFMEMAVSAAVEPLHAFTVLDRYVLGSVT